MTFAKLTNISKSKLLLYIFLLIDISESIINNPQNLYYSSIHSSVACGTPSLKMFMI